MAVTEHGATEGTVAVAEVNGGENGNGYGNGSAGSSEHLTVEGEADTARLV